MPGNVAQYTFCDIRHVEKDSGQRATSQIEWPHGGPCNVLHHCQNEHKIGMQYHARLRRLLTSRERRVFEKLSAPQKIQDYLDSLPINFEVGSETYMSPRAVLRAKTAHCMEGAVFAAAVLAYHGRKPLLLDFRTLPCDEDHVVALFRQNGYWGAISKTNHAILRYREPVYRTTRELAMSFFHEYLLWNGGKSLRSYSAPFDLSKFAPERWVSAEEDLWWLVDVLDKSRHFPAVPKKNLRALRKAYPIELKAMEIVEWRVPGNLKKRSG